MASHMADSKKLERQSVVSADIAESVDFLIRPQSRLVRGGGRQVVVLGACGRLPPPPVVLLSSCAAAYPCGMELASGTCACARISPSPWTHKHTLVCLPTHARSCRTQLAAWHGP